MTKPRITVYDSAVMICTANVKCSVDDDCWPLCHPVKEE